MYTGYEADKDIVKEAQQLAQQHNVKLTLTNDPIESVNGANVVVTDTWISMGQEEEAKKRKIDFKG